MCESCAVVRCMFCLVSSVDGLPIDHDGPCPYRTWGTPEGAQRLADAWATADLDRRVAYITPDLGLSTRNRGRAATESYEDRPKETCRAPNRVLRALDALLTRAARAVSRRPYPIRRPGATGDGRGGADSWTP